MAPHVVVGSDMGTSTVSGSESENSGNQSSCALAGPNRNLQGALENRDLFSKTNKRMVKCSSYLSSRI